MQLNTDARTILTVGSIVLLIAMAVMSNPSVAYLLGVPADFIAENKPYFDGAQVLQLIGMVFVFWLTQTRAEKIVEDTVKAIKTIGG